MRELCVLTDVNKQLIQDTRFFDNYFISYKLLHHLRSIGYNAIGTVRDNRCGNCPVSEIFLCSQVLDTLIFMIRPALRCLAKAYARPTTLPTGHDMAHQLATARMTNKK